MYLLHYFSNRTRRVAIGFGHYYTSPGTCERGAPQENPSDSLCEYNQFWHWSSGLAWAINESKLEDGLQVMTFAHQQVKKKMKMTLSQMNDMLQQILLDLLKDMPHLFPPDIKMAEQVEAFCNVFWSMRWGSDLHASPRLPVHFN